MIKKEITFENLEGEKVTRTYWFNLNKAELAKMQVRHNDFRSYIQAVIDSDNMERIIGVFDELLSLAYGVRGDDGVTFHKSEAAWERFKNSDAYSELFVELLSNPKQTGLFFAGLVPKEFQSGVQEAMKKAEQNVVDVTNLFDQPSGDEDIEETGEPTHEVPQPTPVQDRLAGLTEEEKAELRAQLGM